MQAASNIVVINIGKNGVTPEVAEHVKLLLKQHGRVKLKFLRSAKLDAGVLEPNVIKKIGRTMVLRKLK